MTELEAKSAMDIAAQFEEWKVRALDADADAAQLRTESFILMQRVVKAEEALRAKEEELHYCNGVADLAMKHRDDAEARALKMEAALREIVGLYVGSNPEMQRARDIAVAALDKQEGE